MKRLERALSAPWGRWTGVLIWAMAWPAMFALAPFADLPNLAMIPVLASALAALWSSPLRSVIAGLCAALAFNFIFVPPHWAISIAWDWQHHHALLLITAVAVSAIISWQMERLRQLAKAERVQSLRASQLQALGDSLRDAEDPLSCAEQLQAALSYLVQSPVRLMVLTRPLPERNEMDACLLLDPVEGDDLERLWLCVRESWALGHDTGRLDPLPAWYLPMRGRKASFGAALLPLDRAPEVSLSLRTHAQALCDQMGLALERAMANRTATMAREEARAQKLRNTMLAAISHDYRTPLAAILSAASSLHDQDDRLTGEQRQRLTAAILDEAEQLGRLTDNTLQLARLDSPGLTLNLDWESVEEIVGTVLRRARQRDPAHPAKALIQPALPLLRCDAVLLVQMLENLVDNAIKYGGEDSPVEIVAQGHGDTLLLAVRDRGPGVPPDWRERIFDVFQRADGAQRSTSTDAPARRGAGVGLAVCRTIARAHGGELRLRMRAGGGCSFECSLPMTPPPVLGPIEETAP